MPQLSDRHIEWLSGERRIDVEAALRRGLYTGRAENGRVMPDASGNVLVFPQIEGGKVVNEKYRQEPKRFWQMRDGLPSFFNAEVLDDPALEEGHYPLIITEGELDALAVETAGHPHVVSVPDGAPPPGSKVVDISRDAEGKFAFMWRHREKLRKIKRFVLCVDADGPGQQLLHELTRRLGPARCSRVAFPDGCKDANDVLIKHGSQALTALINTAQPMPVRGLHKMAEYPEVSPPPLYSTGWSVLDPHLKLYDGELVVVTGVPSHGKSTWTLHLIANLARIHKLNACIASFEMTPMPYVRDVLRETYVGKPWHMAQATEREQADRWINARFVFMESNPRTDDEEPTLDWVCERAEDAMLRYGSKILLVDPWNQVEHRRRPGEQQEEYIARALRGLRRLAHSLGMIVIVVVHPTKEVKGKDGVVRRPGLYDVSGAAHWYNAADHGIVIWRPDSSSNTSEIHVEKVRFRRAGAPGMAQLQFSSAARRFEWEDAE